MKHVVLAKVRLGWANLVRLVHPTNILSSAQLSLASSFRRVRLSIVYKDSMYAWLYEVCRFVQLKLSAKPLLVKLTQS